MQQTGYKVAFQCPRVETVGDRVRRGAGRSARPQGPERRLERGERTGRVFFNPKHGVLTEEAVPVRFRPDAPGFRVRSVYRVGALTSSRRGGPCACAHPYKTQLGHSGAGLTPNMQMHDVMGSPPATQT